MDNAEEMFNKNINIAYKISSEYKNWDCLADIQQIALLGLWKSILKFDSTRNIKFSTFAYSVIKNEINFYLRKIRKHGNNISINTIIYDDLTLEDAMADEKDYIGELIDFLDKQKIFNKIDLTDRQKKILELTKVGKTQKNIAKILNISQPEVSRDIKRIKNKIMRVEGGYN